MYSPSRRADAPCLRSNAAKTQCATFLPPEKQGKLHIIIASVIMS
ncbi:hypothetical protein ETAE_1273 [Edwardsiella piscicida]|uniref:Uncharacterized protein n=1 Tax=Edwardsiella piscicida TaxID=1263550 RepID=A0AAU8PD60_EDWPI|nr:hypothetical protein ETAE_1273 [Edwardsiella tarda EIB202]